MNHPFANNFYNSYYPTPEEINYYYPPNYPLSDQLSSDPYMVYQSMFNYPFYPFYPPHQQTQHKIDNLSVKGTTDYERPQEVKIVEKQQNLWVKDEVEQQKQKGPYILAQNQSMSNMSKTKMKKPKLKKNTEANIVNNIVSFLSIEVKSHHVIKNLLVDKEKMKIFYIFMNNLKKMNNKYLNKKILESLLLLEPGSPYEKMLQKSVKRLEILPLSQLRDVIRKSTFSYLRGHYSIFPLFTSKKIGRISMKQHLEKRRHLVEYLLDVLKRNSY